MIKIMIHEYSNEKMIVIDNKEISPEEIKGFS